MLFLGASPRRACIDGVRIQPRRRRLGVRAQTTSTLISVYAMRMAAVFTLTVSTVVLRTAAVTAVSRSSATVALRPAPPRRRQQPLGGAGLPCLGARAERRDPALAGTAARRRVALAPCGPPADRPVYFGP